MILQLLKKDCIIAKNYVAAVILIGVGLPVLLVWKQPQMLEAFALPGAVFISSVAFNLAVSEKENIYPKATALLCATPYNREKLVEEVSALLFNLPLLLCGIPDRNASDSPAGCCRFRALCCHCFLDSGYLYGHISSHSIPIRI